MQCIEDYYRSLNFKRSKNLVNKTSKWKQKLRKSKTTKWKQKLRKTTKGITKGIAKQVGYSKEKPNKRKYELG